MHCESRLVARKTAFWRAYPALSHRSTVGRPAARAAGLTKNKINNACQVLECRGKKFPFPSLQTGRAALKSKRNIQRKGWILQSRMNDEA